MKKGEKILWGFVGLLVLVTIFGGVSMEWVRQHSDKPMFPILTHYDFSGDGLKGFQLYRESDCNGCHRAVGSGTSMGVSLDGLGSKHDANYFYNFLKEPEKTFAALGTKTLDHGKKPKDAAYVSNIPDADLHAIAVFLSQLKSDQGSSSSFVPPEGDSSFIDAMLDMWVPDLWRGQYKDIRVKTTTEQEEKHDTGTK